MKAPTVSDHLKSESVGLDPVLGRKYIFFVFCCVMYSYCHICKGFMASDIIKVSESLKNVIC